jgi:DNA-binding transcriptional ArsR family regulator
MSHETNETSPAVDAESAELIARIMGALSTASRVRILGVLREGPCGVTGLADRLQLEMSTVSHQLRILRDLGLITPTRNGRTISYALHDEHVALLIDQAIYHLAHRRLGLTEPLMGSATHTAHT